MLHILTHQPSQLQEVTATVIPPTLQLRELRHGDVNGLARGHPAGSSRVTQAAWFQSPCTHENMTVPWEKEKQGALYSSIPQKWFLRKLLTLRQFRWRLEFQRGNQRWLSLLLSVCIPPVPPSPIANGLHSVCIITYCPGLISNAGEISLFHSFGRFVEASSICLGDPRLLRSV